MLTTLPHRLQSKKEFSAALTEAVEEDNDQE